MRPMRIYINPDRMLSKQDCGIFSDKKQHDLTAEYTDLSQVWHDAKEEVDWYNAAPGVFVQYANGDFAVFFSAFSTMDERHPKIARWAYIKDLLPNG